jgi:hypothetical protein
VKKVVLAYSGGLDTSVAVAWLREQFDAEVVTLTVDLGGGSLRPGVERRAMSAGASRAYVVDARERFITDFVWPHLQANALYQGDYPLATALARPLIAQLLVEVAAREGAEPVRHAPLTQGLDVVKAEVRQRVRWGLRESVLEPCHVRLWLFLFLHFQYSIANSAEGTSQAIGHGAFPAFSVGVREAFLPDFNPKGVQRPRSLQSKSGNP